MKNIGVLLFIVMMMVSCSKEESLETGGSGGSGGGGGTGGGGVTGAKLVKMTSNFTLVPNFEFFYDASNRFIRYRYLQDFGGGSGLSGETRYTRDASGRIIRQVDVNEFSGDSSITTYVYVNTTDRKVKFGIEENENNPFKDSLAFTYTGELCTKITTFRSGDNGESYERVAEFTYRYDTRNNLIESIESESDGTAIVPAFKYVYEYDARVNPLYFKDDVLLLNTDQMFLSPNNFTKLSFTALDLNITIPQSITYQYRSDNKPSKANGSYSGAPYTIDFTYQ